MSPKQIFISLLFSISAAMGQDCRRASEFGVYPTDTYPDQSGIQNAINSIPDGGCIYFPQGEPGYIISGTPVSIKKEKNFRIKGDGNTKFLVTNTNGFVIGSNQGKNDLGKDRWDGLIIENITIDMTNAPGYVGLTCSWYDMLKLDRVTVTGGSNTVAGGGAVGVLLDYCYDNTLLEVQCKGQTQKGLYLKNSCDKTVIIGGQFGSGDKGIVIEGGKAISITGASVENNESTGLELGYSMLSGRTEFPSNVNIIGNYLENNCVTRSPGSPGVIKGAAYMVIGAHPGITTDYTRGINIIGNYFNWGKCSNYGGDDLCINRPLQTSAAPFIQLEHASVVNISGNHYLPIEKLDTVPPIRSFFASILAGSAGNAGTDVKRVQAIGDFSIRDIGGFVKTEQILVPINLDVILDQGNNGYAELNLLDSNFTSVTATANANTNHSGTTRLDIVYFRSTSNPTIMEKIRIYIVGGIPDATPVNVTGILIGKR